MKPASALALPAIAIARSRGLNRFDIALVNFKFTTTSMMRDWRMAAVERRSAL